MRRPRLAIVGSVVLAGVCAVVASAQRTGDDVLAPLRVKIVLVGDSTVTEGSGWGLGFRELAGSAVDVVNHAANGRSSKSYRDEGLWAKALAERGHYYLIQFGHNDEPGKGPERETIPETTYTENMRRYVQEVRAQGRSAVLVTSLVRRIFDAQTGKIRSTQTRYVAAVRQLAGEMGVPLVDLFASSSALCEQLGPKALVPLSPRQENGETDTTHLNREGSRVFARLVIDRLPGAVPSLGPQLPARP